MMLGAGGLAALAAAGTAGAQGAEGRLAVGGGTATDARGVTSTAVTVAPALSLSGESSLLVLGGSFTRFAGEGWTVGGNAAVAERTALGERVHLTLDLGGGIARTSFDATYATGEAVPAVELRLAPLVLFA